MLLAVENLLTLDMNDKDKKILMPGNPIELTNYIDNYCLWSTILCVPFPLWIRTLHILQIST